MIKVVYSGNSMVFKGIFLSCMSMIKNCKEPLKIYILSMDLTEQNPCFRIITSEQIAALNKILKSVNEESEAVLFDVGNIYNELFKNTKNKNTEYTPYCLNRLFIDLIEDIDGKVIYMDVDTMLVGDIKSLYDVSIDGYEFGAALDFMGKFWISPTYTNSGIMLINVDEVRRTGMMEKCRKLIQTKWMKMPDQTALNKSVLRKKYIDGRFNEQRDIKEDTVVKHFCKGIKWTPFFHIYNIKQWETERVHRILKIHDFDDIYEKYAKLIKIYPAIEG